MVSLWDLELLQTQISAARAYHGVKRPSQLHNSTDPGAGVVTGSCEGLDRHTQS